MNQQQVLEVKDLAKPCNNVLGKLGWKWEPEVGEQFIWDEQVWTIGGIKGKWFIVVNTEYGTTTDRLLSSLRKYISILPWEQIERVVEGLGYVFQEPIRRCYGSEGFKCHSVIEKGGKRLAWAWGKSRQEAVMRSVIELAKELTRT